ncbi:MAG TPA: S9 family peptidase [Pyrinomonadaceae bacterium]|jgi:dipeptidyl aminopeptidase/acylaminoacyl peptidase|nr:S9 family peptidase [Pyrinomonadaceae bacterium]
MKRSTVSVLVFTLALLCAAPAATAVAQTARRPMTVDDLLKVRRVGDPQLSPDGRFIAYQISDPDKAANRSRTHIYLIPTTGGEPVQLTNGDASASTPRWSPDGKRIAFVRGGQIYTMDATGGDVKKITSISTGAGDPVWSPDGRWLAFASDIYPGCADDACNQKRDAEVEASKVKAKVIDRLLYRHWTAWKDGKRSHVFVVSADGGAARDLTPGDFDAPPFSLGGQTDYAFSPDSKELAFARNTEKVEATSTNNDIFIVPLAGGEPQRITGDNKGSDQSPVYSPDGRYLAYRSQAIAGFESARWRLMLYDRQTKKTRELLSKFDAYVEGFTFTPDGKHIYFVSGERGRNPIYMAATEGDHMMKVLDGFNDDVKISADGKTLVFTRSSMTQPIEIFRARLIDPMRVDMNTVAQVTKTNDAYLAGFSLPPAEELTWEGGGGTKIHGWLVKPANYTADKKHPLVVLIHGGPQGAWNDTWSYRWNPQIFASAGYMVFMPNPRGSIGYGQQFIDEISGDWAGKVYTDILNGVAQVSARPDVDKERVGAAGGSYGGYMVNWILGHNDDPRVRFKALVSHAGVFNLVSMYGVTEELWFPEWEFKGTPWDNPELYTRWSPHLHAKNFKTPTLVTHGELDFRVPIGEGFQLFTYLQKQNVPSKLLYFPDEGHWIMKPQNSALWYNTVLGWFDTYLKQSA